MSINIGIRDEFYLDQTFTSADHAKNAAKNAIKFYNTKRLHLSLNYRTPKFVHQYAA